MNKIEIITQHSDAAEKDPEHSAVAKLQELIEENPEESKEEEENPEESKEEEDKDRRERKLKRKEKRQQRDARKRETTSVSPNPTIEDSDFSNKVVQDRGKVAEGATKSTTTTDKKLYRTSSSSSSSESDTNYDDDGFEIPPGKIPLDGHFSTEELELLVDIAKKEGFLKDDVNVKVIGTSELFGDKVLLSEEQQPVGEKVGTKQEEDMSERKGTIESKETQGA